MGSASALRRAIEDNSRIRRKPRRRSWLALQGEMPCPLTGLVHDVPVRLRTWKHRVVRAKSARGTRLAARSSHVSRHSARMSGMKILVAMRQVPERDAALAIAAGAGWIEDSALSYSTNEPDAYALEEALRLKDSLAPAAGEVIALTAGPERAASVLRDALARGADRALHIVTQSGPPQHDPLPLAHLLAAAVRAESPDLILTGLQSDDLGLGQTGVILAELLGIPHTTLGLHVETVASGIRVKRELEDGWFQHVEMALPALVTIQS